MYISGGGGLVLIEKYPDGLIVFFDYTHKKELISFTEIL